MHDEGSKPRNVAPPGKWQRESQEAVQGRPAWEVRLGRWAEAGGEGTLGQCGCGVDSLDTG